MAFLPAVVELTMQQWRQRSLRSISPWILPTALSLMFGILPVILLVLVWKGLSSPGMVSGSSYRNWTASVGINLYRPLIAGFYIALYSLPLTFPAMTRIRPEQRWRALAVATLFGCGSIPLLSTLFPPGPLNSLIRALFRKPHGQPLLFPFIVSA